MTKIMPKTTTQDSTSQNKISHSQSLAQASLNKLPKSRDGFKNYGVIMANIT